MQEPTPKVDNDFKISVLLYILDHLHHNRLPKPCENCESYPCFFLFLCPLIIQEVKFIREAVQNDTDI